MPFPDRLLDDDEVVLAHVHPHAAAVVRPVICLFLLVGAASFAAASVPAGALQGPMRLGVLVLAVGLGVTVVGRPLVRWGTTHYVLTTSRLLVRAGVLSRRGRDVALCRITGMSSRQSLGQRLLGSGTVVVETAGEDPAVVLDRVPHREDVVALLHRLVREDDDGADGQTWADGDWDDGGWDDARDDGATAVQRRW
jgi:uncharacterized membrane protein YdbT with pleckstrin-like domain